jgi:XTP/dITP diphosphohydrolase
LIATRNGGKLLEFRDLLIGLRVPLVSLSDFGSVIDIDETGSTLSENAELKASGYATQVGLWTMADDTGLEVDALNGAPGVQSARYAGRNASDLERITRVLSEIELSKNPNRLAMFRCAIAIADPTGSIAFRSEGSCKGQILHTPTGVQGFGYDSIFIPDGFNSSFGELPSVVKNKISHRSIASAAAREFLERLFDDASLT